MLSHDLGPTTQLLRRGGGCFHTHAFTLTDPLAEGLTSQLIAMGLDRTSTFEWVSVLSELVGVFEYDGDADEADGYSRLEHQVYLRQPSSLSARRRSKTAKNIFDRQKSSSALPTLGQHSGLGGSEALSNICSRKTFATRWADTQAVSFQTK